MGTLRYILVLEIYAVILIYISNATHASSPEDRRQSNGNTTQLGRSFSENSHARSLSGSSSARSLSPAKSLSGDSPARSLSGTSSARSLSPAKSLSLISPARSLSGRISSARSFASPSKSVSGNSAANSLSRNSPDRTISGSFPARSSTESVLTGSLSESSLGKSKNIEEYGSSSGASSARNISGSNYYQGKEPIQIGDRGKTVLQECEISNNLPNRELGGNSGRSSNQIFYQQQPRCDIEMQRSTKTEPDYATLKAMKELADKENPPHYVRPEDLFKKPRGKLNLGSLIRTPCEFCCCCLLITVCRCNVVGTIALALVVIIILKLISITA